MEKLFAAFLDMLAQQHLEVREILSSVKDIRNKSVFVTLLYVHLRTFVGEAPYIRGGAGVHCIRQFGTVPGVECGVEFAHVCHRGSIARL